MFWPGIELAIPRFQTGHLRTLSHRDICFVAFKTLSESNHI